MRGWCVVVNRGDIICEITNGYKFSLHKEGDNNTCSAGTAASRKSEAGKCLLELLKAFPATASAEQISADTARHASACDKCAAVYFGTRDSQQFYALASKNAKYANEGSIKVLVSLASKLVASGHFTLAQTWANILEQILVPHSDIVSGF